MRQRGASSIAECILDENFGIEMPSTIAARKQQQRDYDDDGDDVQDNDNLFGDINNNHNHNKNRFSYPCTLCYRLIFYFFYINYIEITTMMD